MMMMRRRPLDRASAALEEAAGFPAGFLAATASRDTSRGNAARPLCPAEGAGASLPT